MLQRNAANLIKSRPFLIGLLIATLSIIFCVIYTAFGTITSLYQFMTDYGNVRYLVVPNKQMRANELALSDCDVDGIREQVFAVSSASREESAVIVGVFGKDCWIPKNDVELFWEQQETIENLIFLRHKAYLSSEFYNLYEYIEPWVDTIVIENTIFDVVGMAEFYFGERGVSHVLSATEIHGFDATLPPLISTGSGERIEYPEGFGTILISGNDFMELNLPLSFISIVFEEPPSYEQYHQMRGCFDENHFDIDPYRTGATGITLAHINGLICGVAVLLSVMLTCGLIKIILDANQDVWRGLYLIGCTKVRLLTGTVSLLAMLYTAAAIISAIPCYFILKHLTTLKISIGISIGALALLVVLSVLFVILATLPTCILAVRRYTREEDAYVQTI